MQGRADELTEAQMNEMNAYQREFFEWTRSELGFNSKEEPTSLSFRPYQILTCTCALSGQDCVVRIWDESDDADQDYLRLVGKSVIFQSLQCAKDGSGFQSTKQTAMQELPLGPDDTMIVHRACPNEGTVLSTNTQVPCEEIGRASCRERVL